MNPRLKQALQLIVFFGLGLGLMYWQFSNFNEAQKTEFFRALREANYGWFTLAIFVGMLAHLSRAIRWQQLLAPLGLKAGLGSRFYAVMIGYLANYGIPRSGEVIRCGVLKTSDEIPFGEAFGTVVVERIIDMLCLLLVFVIVIIAEFSQLESLWSERIWNPACEKFAKLGENHTLMIVLIGGLVLMIAAFWFLRKKIRSMISGKLGKFLGGFKNGIMAVRRVPKPGWFIFHSLFIWTGYLSSMYICFFCFDVTTGLSVNTALILLLFGTFGVAFTPGGIGAYQVLVTGVLAYLLINTYGFHGEQKDVEPLVAPFAWLSWFAQVATVVLFTGIASFSRRFLNKLSK